jgi:hydrogenase maturation protease
MNATENETQENPRILVIGYGNPMRGDDGVGWVASQKLAEQVDCEHVACIAVHQLTPELSDLISRVELVIFIDAAEGATPGSITCSAVEPVCGESQRAMTHHMSPQGLLIMAQRIFGHQPRAVLFAVGGEDFGHKEELSDTVEAACEVLVGQIRETIAAALREHGSP